MLDKTYLFYKNGIDESKTIHFNDKKKKRIVLDFMLCLVTASQAVF